MKRLREIRCIAAIGNTASYPNEMAPFYPIFVRRSDGKLEVVSQQRKREKNEPTAEQLDRTPDASGVSDFYRQVKSDEVKNIDWRRKLGGMIAREMIKGTSLG